MPALDQVARLQAEIWGSEEVAAPSYLLKAMAEAGGIVLLAEADRSPVGFVYGFTGRSQQGAVYHRSHAAGVLPGLRDAGIGRALKLAQRQQALAQGLDLMVWTFDPTQGRNAHFNLNRLGATARSFRRDYYGTRSDAVNQGRPSDRLVVEWFLDEASRATLNRLRRRPVLQVRVPPQLLDPGDGAAIANGYRELREGLEKAFAQGLTAIDYDSDAGCYLFAELPSAFPPAVE